jgi:hypothetical protein
VSLNLFSCHFEFIDPFVEQLLTNQWQVQIDSRLLVELNPVLEDSQHQELTSFYRCVKPLSVDIFPHIH